MKKLFIIGTMLFISNSIFAGYSSTERRTCKWWSKKYVAEARVFTGLVGIERNSNCGDAYAEKIKSCAWQKTYRGDSGFWQDGGVKRRICSRGEVITAFDEFFLPVTKVEENIEESQLNTKPTVFDEETHSVILSGISGKIKLNKGNGYYSNMRFSIWRPTDDVKNLVEDTSMDTSEVLHQFEIKVTDEGVFFNGNLANEELNSKFEIQDTGKDVYVVFTDISLEVPIDREIPLDDLAVEVDGDGAPDTKSNVAKVSKDTDLAITSNDFTFNVFPNPTADIVNIEFKNSLVTGNTSIEIYNSVGEKVKNVYNNFLNKTELKSFKIDVSSLPKGNYFILVNSDGKKLSKQIFKK